MFKSNFFTSKKKKLANAEALTEEGKGLIQANDYKGAIVSFSKALQNIATNSIYFVNRAEAYRLDGDYESCIQDCMKALTIEPNVPAYCTKAHALLSLNRVDEALQCSEKALQISSPKDVTDARRMHAMLTEAKNKQQAELFKHKGDEILNTQHDFHKAIEAYTKAISFVSNKFSYYNNRALAYLLYGDYEFAIYDCDKSLALLPNGKAYGRKAAALCDLERVDEAMDCIEKALELLPDNQELLNTERTILDKIDQAHSFKEDKSALDFSSMAMTCTLALKLSKQSYVHYNNRAIAHLGARKIDEAIADCQESLKIKVNMKAFRNLALIYCEANNLVEAFTNINIALEMAPLDGQALDIKRKLERIQNGLEKEKAMARENQIREEKLLNKRQLNARAVRFEKWRMRLERQAIRVRKNYSKLFGKKMVKKGLHNFITAYAAQRAHYIDEENNLLRNQFRARSTRFLVRQENDLIKQQVYSRARRHKPPANTVMSNYFQFGLEAENTPADVIILDKRMNIDPLDREDTKAPVHYEKVAKISRKIFHKLEKIGKICNFLLPT
jgi:tetratricopeptide (TPR) repeat protein